MLSLLAPGQGSQSPGLLTPWLDELPLQALAREFSDAAELDLQYLGTQADQASLTDTAIAQPLIVAASLLSYASCRDRGLHADLTAGHSVGELAALAVAGVLEPAEAVRLAAIRGQAMAKAAALSPTSMCAVVGGTRAEVLAAIEAAGAKPANFNSAAQVVAAGTAEQLAALAQHPPARARVIPLAVAGAFHTSHMAPAQAEFAEAVSQVRPNDPACVLLSNYDGARVTSGGLALDRLVDQIVRPVRWDACMATMAASGVTTVVELAPAGVLAGLAKRELKSATACALASPEDVLALPGDTDG